MMTTERRTPVRLRKRMLAVASSVAVVGAVLLSSVTVLAAKPVNSSAAVDLDQCRNGGLVASPGVQTSVQCAGPGTGNDGWVNGNAGASNAHYAEGESISYRARLSGLNNNDVVTLIMGYDVVHSGVHAIDYLTDKNRWQSPETTVAAKPDLPCSTVTGCDGTTDLLTAPIPEPTTNVAVDVTKNLDSGCAVSGSGATQQPKTSFNAVPAAQRVMEFFDATPTIPTGQTGAIAYVGPTPNILDKSGDQEQQISVTFTAKSATPVLAWGGHIAAKFDWGCADGPRSASGISGSPYHMRIKSIIVNGQNISLGNQDRSLSAAAVIVLATSLPTTPSPSSGAIGAVLNDSATISGGNNPTGTITFKLYSGAVCDAAHLLYTDVENVVSGGANTITTDPKGYTTTAAGTYNWTASYSGDANNLASTSDCGSEAVTIGKNSPTLGTTPSPSSGAIGDTLNDSASLSGASSPTGNIVFKLFPPSDPTCTGTAVYTDTEAIVGTGANTATTDPKGYVSLVAGTYHWTASYAGDDNNNAASSGCSAEPVVIAKNSPTAATTQSLLPNDSFTLSGGSSATGTVDFYLFAPGTTCANTDTAKALAAFHQQKTLASNAAATTNDGTPDANTNNGYTAIAEGTYKWLAVYSGDDNNNTAVSNCVEEFSIDNNNTN